jgi:diaminobutyrate-2-oxoglutarate transaminase
MQTGHFDSSLERAPAPRAAEHSKYLFEPTALLERQRVRESNARSYPRRLPLALRRAKGIYVEDVEGRRYIDCLAAAGTLVLGHNHPVVVDAIRRALDDELPMQTLDLMTPVKDEFVTELFSLLPQEWAREAKVQFCGPTGTDAVEAALKLVRTATGRHNVMAFHGAYHGMSLGSLALMGNLGPKRALAAFGQSVQFLPYPHSYRCPFGLGGEAGERAGLEYIANVLSDPESGVVLPAAIVLEVVQGEGGVIPAPAGWLRRLRELCTKAGVPMVIDEIQTGFGRTGRCFAFEHAGITPDVLVLSKAIGGGLPLSVVVYHGTLDAWQPGAHAGTFRGNQLAMAAGTATLRFLRNEGLAARAELLGERLRQRLDAAARRHPCLGDVRGRGLMLGVEVVDPAGQPDVQGHPPAAPRVATELQRACLERGLILEVGGRHGATLRFLPPLIITEEEIDRVGEIVNAALAEVESRTASPRAHGEVEARAAFGGTEPGRVSC